MTIVFTDLDGTLLDDANYSWEAARPALEELKRRGIPCVLVTSKTRAEVEFWRNRLGNTDPFVVENGAAVFIPKDIFPFKFPEPSLAAGSMHWSGERRTASWSPPWKTPRESNAAK